jgi:uncharacterized protein (TIGR00297 family)
MFFNSSVYLIAAVLMVAAGLSYYYKKLSSAAALTGFICALLIFVGTGYTGLILLASFFIAGTVATSWRRTSKNHLERAGDQGPRKAWQVIANGGAATLMAIMAIFFPDLRNYFTVLLAAAFSSATSDTLSSELGMVYGKRFYNCITWKKDQRGLDGVISLEGLLIGFLSSTLVAGLYTLSDYLLYHMHHHPGFTMSSDTANFIIIMIAGFIGNLSDSVLGATLERSAVLDNNWVNFLSTATAICVSCLLFVSFLLF